MPSTPDIDLHDDYAGTAPSAQGAKLDADHQAIMAWCAAILAALETTIRNDDTFQDATVRYRHLHQETIQAIQRGLGSQETMTPADASVTAQKIVDGQVLTAKLADAGVTTAKIADANVTTAKIALLAITTALLNDKAVTLPKMNDLATRTLIGRLTAGAGVPEAVGFDDLTVIASNASLARSLKDRFRERVSVRDFGAVGNGTTDDTAAIQAAINYVTSTYDPATYASNSPYNGPCSLFFPAGWYKITSALTITKKIALEGEGQSEFSSGARLEQFTSNQDLFQINPVSAGMSVSFERLTLRSNTSGTGHLINITKGAGTCNSIRILDCTFGTPQAHSIRIQGGDDVRIDGCLFDASANNAISLGSATAADVVSNCEVTGCAFYSIPTRCFLLYNVDGLHVHHCRVYGASPRTTHFIDGYNSLPYQLKNLVVTDNVLKSVACLIQATGVQGAVFKGNQGSNCGAGAGSTLNWLEFTGTNLDVVIDGNEMVGSFDTKGAYNDAGGTVTGRISNNVFRATAGTGQALVCTNTTGQIRDNHLPGWGAKSLSERIVTTGSAVNPGLIAAGASYSKTFTLTGAAQGDRVTVGTVTTAWPVNVGVEVEGFISAANTVTVQYRNVTAGGITPAAHDISYEVER